MKITLTYRTRRRLRALGVGAAYVLLTALLVWICWIVWLDRFVVYSGDSAYLDFDWRISGENAEIAQEPTRETVAVYYNEGEDMLNTSTELTQLKGYYVTADDLRESVESADNAIKALPSDSAVMLELKNGYGNFYYSTGESPDYITGQVDVEQVDTLIKNITKGDYYTIAMVSAFRDRAYGLENTVYGLAHTSGAYLWADSDNCYWLNPTSDTVVSRLISIATELRELGFDEVVFTDFCFPDTTNIRFDSSQSEALSQAAQVLVSSCATARFAVSFATSDESFVLPEGRSRLFLQGVDASRAQVVADEAQVADKLINLVFFTDTNDTRFDDFSVVRPIPVA